MSIPHRASFKKSRVPTRVPAGSNEARITKIAVLSQRGAQNPAGSKRVPAGSDKASIAKTVVSFQRGARNQAGPKRVPAGSEKARIVKNVVLLKPGARDQQVPSGLDAWVPTKPELGIVLVPRHWGPLGMMFLGLVRLQGQTAFPAISKMNKYSVMSKPF